MVDWWSDSRLPVSDHRDTSFPIYQFTGPLPRIPKPPPRQPQIPVAQLIHEVGDGPRGAGDIVALQRRRHALHQAVELRQHPAIQHRTLGQRHRRRARIEFVQVGIRHEEAVAVPQRQQELARGLAHQIGAEAPRVAGRAGRVHVPARGIRPVRVEHRPRIDDIAAALRHLAAVLGHDVAQADAVLEVRLAEEQGADGVLRIEPTACLIHRLADVVGRELLGEDLAILERVVPLRHGHRAGIEPAIGHLAHATHDAFAALGARPAHVIHGRPVQIERLGVRLLRIGPLAALLRQIARQHELAPGLRVQLGHRSDALLIPARRVVAHPERQRRAPVALARHAPVDVVRQPLAEAPFLDVLRHPVDPIVVGDELVFERGGLDVPRRARVVEQRRVAAPAERVGVLVDPLLQHQPAVGQILLDQRIGFLDEDAAPRRHRVDEAALRVHRHQRGQAVLLPHCEVVGAEGRRDVHQAGAILRADEIAGEDVAVVLRHRQEGVERPVVPAQELAALRPAQHGHLPRVLPEDRSDQRFGQPQLVVFVLHQHVVDLFADGHGDVARQRPRRGRPDQQVDAGLIAQRELDVDARIFGAFLVALRQLMAGERRAAARAIGHHFVALVDQPAIPVLLEDPPQRLDVVVGQRPVRRRQIDPVAEAFGQLLPLVHVVVHALAALLDEGRDAVLLDGFLAGEAELLLDIELDRQAVGVPAALARDVVAAHGLVAREDILERPRQHMVDAGPAVRGRRPLVEDVARPGRGLPLRLAEHVGLFPETEHVLLHRGQVNLGGNVMELGHGNTSQQL